MRECLAEYEFRLWHRAFCCIGKQYHPICHIQNALNLSAKIRVARRINNINTRVLPGDGCWLGENGNAAFFFQVAGVHDAFIDRLVISEQAGLFHNRVNECGFAMVNMGNNGNIAQILRRGGGHKGTSVIGVIRLLSLLGLCGKQKLGF